MLTVMRKNSLPKLKKLLTLPGKKVLDFHTSSINFSDDNSLGAPAGVYCLTVLSTHLLISHGVPINLAFFSLLLSLLVVCAVS